MMTVDEYNAYIKNYMDNDKTKSAIMLTAPWGMGKSYYIQNSLIPYLNSFNNKSCVVISLYGMNELSEISKSIFLELRMKQFNKGGEKTKAGILAAKTVLKGVAGVFGVGLDMKPEDLDKLYASVDLSGKLIILEDLERTDIDIKQVLGFVNNLVEQDGTKVLLVANENEIIKYIELTEKDEKGNEIQKKTFSEETQEYLRIKEKSVSDTILFLCDFNEAILNILKSFDSKDINKCIADDAKKLSIEIQEIMVELSNFNLRSLLFACQKVTDMFTRYGETVDSGFFRAVLLSVVAFSLRIKQNEQLKWEENTIAGTLGTYKYPLYRFCYDYIKYQQFDASEIKRRAISFVEKKEFEEKNAEMRKSLNVLYSFPTNSQSAVEVALEDIRDKLCKKELIPITEYGTLSNYLIAARDSIDCPQIIDECKEIMLEALLEEDYDENDVLESIESHNSIRLWTEEQESEYVSFSDQMREAVQKHIQSPFSVDLTIENLSHFIELLRKDEDKYLSQHAFFCRIDPDRLAAVISEASAEQISDLRRLILSVYAFSNIRDYYSGDKESLICFKKNIVEILSGKTVGDKIITLQLEFLRDNLARIINKL